ncbi:hypothetical protein, partial [Aurantimonas coralicida]|uniref:hypothetical protein n=1 Tax=Aurantimonas coralicida TaxID=182270 RepID=UPI0023A432A4
MSVAYRARRLFIMLRTKWPSTSFAIAIFLDIALMIYIAMELSPFYEKPSITREQISEHLDPYQVALVVSYYEKPPSTEVPLILDLDIKVNSLVYSTSQIIFSYEPGVVDVVPSSNPIFSASVAMRDVLSRGDLYEVGASVYHVDLRSLSGFLGIIIIITVSPFLLRLARRGGAERKNGQRLDVDEAASTREILLAEIAFTEESANEIATRSYIALFSGILMSFVGVSTFYITMPSEREVGYGQQSLDALSRLHLANFSRNISESLSASGSDAANNIAQGRGVDDGSRSVPLSPAPLTITEAPVSSVWNSYYFI